MSLAGLDLKNVSLFAGSGFDSAIPGAPGKSEIHTGFESQHNMTIQARLQSLLLEWTHTMVLLKMGSVSVLSAERGYYQVMKSI